MNRFLATLLLVLTTCMTLPATVTAQETHKDETKIIQLPPGGTITPDPEVKPDRVARIIIDATNRFREDEHRSTLRVNKQLTETARAFARYMAENDRYGHHADGQQPADRAKKQGYDYCIVLENIAYYYNSAGTRSEEMSQEFFHGWKNSPGHRRNMLDRDVSETGVAIARSAKSGHYYAVQLFGRPASERIEFQLANRLGMAIEYKVLDKTFSLEPRTVRIHQVCRPLEVTLTWPGADGKALTRTFKPVTGKRYVLRKDEKGGLQIGEEAVN